MRAVLQVVNQASVTVGENTVGACGYGLLILLGVAQGDTQAHAELLWNKIARLRIFPDENQKTNLSITDVHGQALIVSQFTLMANCKKGNRPSFTEAAPPVQAKELYEYFVELASRDLEHVQTGQFAAHMLVRLENSGPFTIVLDTDDL